MASVGNGYAAQRVGWSERERIVHYLEQSARFGQMGELETRLSVRADLLDLARQYARLAEELEAQLSDVD